MRNVLLISWHDLGRHLGCYGRPDVRSPRLDRLAAEGVRLDRFFAANPICSPARASLMSGQYPHRHGLQGLVHDGWRLKPEVRLAEEYFRDAGYHTAIVGYQHERPKGEPCPCDDFWTESTRAADVAPEVCRRLEDYARDGKPFFLRTGFFEVHRPLRAESDEGWEDVQPLEYLKDTGEHRRQLAKYHKIIERADAAVGQILDSLERTGLSENTLVVFVTDHGVPFPGAKLTLYDAGLQVAGILRAPGKLPAGHVVSSLVSGVDLLPTLLELCEVPGEPGCFDGSSVASALTGIAETRKCVFAERAMPALMRSVREERFKYILNFDELPPSRLMGAEELQTPLCVSLPDSLIRKNPTEELFDLDADPFEKANLARDPAFAEVRERLRKRLRKWMKETDDPVLRRDVLSPRFETAWQIATGETGAARPV